MASKTKSKPSQRSPTQQASLFILQYKTRRVLVGSPADYDQLQFSIRHHFPDIPVGHRVSYHTNELSISKGALVEVSEDVWDTAIPLLNSLMVQTEPERSSLRTSEKRQQCDSSCDEKDRPKPLIKKRRRDAGLSSEPPQVPPISRAKKETFTLNISSIDGGKSVEIQCTPSTTPRRVLSTAVERLGLDGTLSFRVLYEGEMIGSVDNGSWIFGNAQSPTIQELDIMDGGYLVLVPRIVGGKPVIYLFPPSGRDIDASVKLSLTPEWHFSAIYPVVPITPCTPESGSVSAGQTLQWDVKASSDGTLLEKNTGLDVAYLFWEAEAFALPAKHLSLPSSAPIVLSSSKADYDGESMEARFIPNQPRIEPSDSVVLEVAKLTPYLDSMLNALGLHLEARTSFITYWLPSFLKHTHIALRFLPQSAYECAAPLEVEPKPDVTVRIFMLFKGLKQDDVQNEGSSWCEATEADAGRWKSVVGIDKSRSLADNSLFRVVEWGGMEVLS